MKRLNRSVKLRRYLCALAFIAAMTGAAELLGEQEVIFPEIAALTVGLWIIDKRVWRIGRLQLAGLMTLAAFAGIAIVRFSPLPLPGNIALAFLFAAVCLTAAGATLPPLISACMLPVILGTESIVYPLAVLVLTLGLAGGQRLMEKGRLRHSLPAVPSAPRRYREEITHWAVLLAALLLLTALPIYSGWTYCILPPLVVTFVEFSRPAAGLRKAAPLIFGLLAVAGLLGAGTHYLVHVQLGLPVTLSATVVCGVLFLLFERCGRLFAPASAAALVPTLIPESDLVWFPLQVAAGAALFIGAAMLLFREPAAAKSTETAESQP